MQKNVCKCNVENEGLRRDQKYMQEYISFSCSRFLVHDAIAYTRVSKNCSVNRKTVNSVTQRSTCKLQAICRFSLAHSPPGKSSQRDSEKEVLVVSLLASLLAVPCDGSREGCKTM